MPGTVDDYRWRYSQTRLSRHFGATLRSVANEGVRPHAPYGLYRVPRHEAWTAFAGGASALLQ